MNPCGWCGEYEVGHEDVCENCFACQECGQAVLKKGPCMTCDLSGEIE